jgi:acetyl-CoA carboxylase carboxyl transferase subunit alpha
LGGAQRDPLAAIKSTGQAILRNIDSLSDMSSDRLRQHRREKFLEMGSRL